jgi:Zn-dependent M16 (insulinase) family peptidase
MDEAHGDYLALFEVNGKGLYSQISHLFAMTKEIIFHSHITDKERLREIISQMKNNLQQRNNQAGHAAAANRALSYFSESAFVKEKMEGIDFYEFVKDLEENFEERYEELAEELNRVRRMIFNKKNLMISYTADELPGELLEQELLSLYGMFYEKEEESVCEKILPVVKNEGFKTSSKVQYVAKAGNFLRKGFSYSGALKVLHMIFSYEYLWQNIRVKGGAYGCMCGFTRLGNAYFTSYRDPNLSGTLDVYKKAWEFVEKFDADDRDMTKFIIGAIGNLDAPVDAMTKGMQMFRAWLMGVDTELVQKERDELLLTNQETIRSLAPLIKAAFEEPIVCVIGNENKLEQEKEHFEVLRSIF